MIFTPEINDPTAGRVAISRELASEHVRLIADPAPLGLGAFALTTLLLSLANAGIMPAASELVVFGVALAYVFLLGFGALSATPTLTWLGGVLGIVAAAIAWYLCLAGVTAATFGRRILPNPPLFTA